MEELFYKLKLLKEEDFIWLIYFFIIIFSLISNKYEKSYLYTNNKQDLEYASKITTTILIVAFFIYLYFVIVSYNNIEVLKRTSNQKEVKIAYERLITNIIFLIGGAISIYADYDSKQNNSNFAIF